MRIQHNIMAMNAYRNYNNNTSALSKNLERLSSGYKINRAGDDAAGLAISEKMRAQITGLEAAQKNVKDGISLVNTAEGAMQEIQDMLNRMVYLATQSANGTYDNEVDRANLQKEVESLKSEINRIADSANFNGIKLLDGSLDKENTGRLSTIEEATSATIKLPADGTSDPNVDMIGDKTVLKKDGVDAAKTVFKVDLRTLSVNAEDGDSMTVQIGEDDTLTIEFDDAGDTSADGTGTLDAENNKLTLKSGAYSTEDLAKAIAKAFNTTDEDNPALTIGGQTFKATAAGNTITFEQLNEPADSTEVVNGALEVKIDYTGDTTRMMSREASGTESTESSGDAGATTPTYEMSGTAKKASITDATWDSSSNSVAIANAPSSVTIADDSSDGLDATAILAAINATDAAIDGAVTIKGVQDDQGNVTALGLYANNTLIGQAELGGATEVPANSGTAAAFEFKTLDGATSLGKITAISQDGNTVALAAAFNDGSNIIATGLATDSANVGVTATIAGTDNLANKLQAAGATTTDSISVAYDSSNSKWTITAGSASIDVADANVDDTSGVLTLKDDDGNALMTITLSDTTKGVSDAQSAAAFTSGFDTGLKIAEKSSTSDTEGPGGGNTEVEVNVSGSPVTNAVAGANGTLGNSTASNSVGVGSNSTTVDFSGLDTAAILNKLGDEAGAASENATAIEMSYNSSSSQFELKVGATVVATSDSAVDAAEIDFGDFGTVAVTADNSDTLDASFWSSPVDSGLDYTGVNNATNGANIDMSNLDSSAIANHIKSVLGANAVDANNEPIGLGFDAQSNKLQLKLGDTVIGESADLSTLSLSDTAATDVQITAIGFTRAAGDVLGTVSVQLTSSGGALDSSSIPGGSLETGLTFTARAQDPDDDTTSSSGMKGQYEGKTLEIATGTEEREQQLASTSLKLGEDVQIKDGHTLKIGDTEFVFKVGAESTVEAGDGQTLIDLSKYEEDSADLIDAAGELLSNQTASGAFDIGYESGTKMLGVFEQEGQTKYTKGELEKHESFEALFGTGTIAKTEKGEPGKPLFLQIGDTSDDFNRMEVSIGDMHTDGAMNIADIDIGTPEGAKEAINVIKDAINYVSSVRGDLGAISNRLDHTANNLSVMAENITDAESTIRDTDIAEEMMAYTKNNILVQSAQAMLAQANQVPQGVLQLLQ